MHNSAPKKQPSQKASMSPLLEDLPAELLVNIVSYLTTPEYGNVRRTCATVEKKLFDSFGREFFKRKQFMLTQLSLQTLIDISNHEALRCYLTKVIIGTNFIPNPDLVNTHHYSQDLKAWHLEQYMDQRYLLDQGIDTIMLTEALSNLPSCHEIEIRDNYCPNRGRGDEKWTSYGSTDFMNRCMLTHWKFWKCWTPEERHTGPSHVFSTVTRAVAIARKMKEYTAFMITTRMSENNLKQDEFYIPRQNLVEYKEAFKFVTTLMIPIQAGPELKPDLTAFNSFLRLFPSLSHLRLNGTGPHGLSYIMEPWLEAAKDALGTCPIRQLDLGKMKVSRPVVENLAFSFKKTLEHLEFFHVQMIGSCSDIFDKLHENLPRLNVVRVHGLSSEILEPRQYSDVMFKLYANNLRSAMKFTGLNWLDNLKECLFIRKEESLSSDSSDEDIDEDSDMEGVEFIDMLDGDDSDIISDDDGDDNDDVDDNDSLC